MYACLGWATKTYLYDARVADIIGKPEDSVFVDRTGHLLSCSGCGYVGPSGDATVLESQACHITATSSTPWP